MREIRDAGEAILDKALYLALIDLVTHRKGNEVVGNRVKCMKLPFLVEYPMFEEKSKGFNMVFFQYEYGPISKHIYEIWRDLEEIGCIVFRDRNWIELTEQGHELAHRVLNEVLGARENEYFLNCIKEVADKYGARESVTPVVYAMEVYAQELGERMKVRDAPVGVTFTYVIEEEEARKKLNVPQSWVETLAIELNPSNIQSVTNALEDYRLGRILSHDEVWEFV
jgi:DNA-binding PadR family transcriptional regulator